MHPKTPNSKWSLRRKNSKFSDQFSDHLAAAACELMRTYTNNACYSCFATF
nr:MAG TPA: hypothetical protein [Caudoviricetes sp.]DAX08609.1 MAG TPA: hypothetical protein [Caudoviricetes sp.]